MQYKTVIFDLDGTLLNTLDDLAGATNYALTQHGLPTRTKDEVRWFVGNGIRKLIKRAVPAEASAELQEQVYATFNTYYKAHCNDKTKAYDGIMELLAALRKAGCRTAIVSNKADYGVQELVKQYFAGQLDAACGEREGIAKKPAPDMLFAVMEKLGAEKNATIYIGDSDTDIETARNAGIPCIGACWGFRGRDFLVQHGAKLLAENPQEVLQLLEA
ncbi:MULTISPECIES: HAD family hydrolase [Phascolarctobacterium]|mgnify:FL=1|uniref:HAD family hydrolase n=1 Tax=Phascolarctobacterium TaxID=33024 RepID=UPI0026EE725E|nr:HAD-IA family hydrolase [Phascolarctobacterium succinatutens]